jgi:alpha-tubulin suppressor-like RCC1 family protein
MFPMFAGGSSHQVGVRRAAAFKAGLSATLAIVVVVMSGLSVNGATAHAASPMRFAAVDAGEHHTCALTPERSVVCWGSNKRAQAAPPAGRFRTIDAGWGVTCAISTSSALACWGDPVYGALVPPTGDFESVSVETGTACAVTPAATVACWGNKIGISQAGAPAPGNFRSVKVGNDFGCGVRVDSTIACWGDDSRGQVSEVPSGAFTAVSTGLGFACGLATTRALDCWGLVFGNRGQTDPPAGEFIAVTTGDHHGCAIRTDSAIVCWGVNFYGESIPPAGRFKAVSAGSFHTCGLRTDSTVTCWGYNEFGQTSVPVAIRPTEAFDVPTTKRCVSRRNFRIRVRKLPGITWASADVVVNGKRVKTLKGARITARVDLRGLPKGRYTVTISATASDGRVVTDRRRYRTCAGVRS